MSEDLHVTNELLAPYFHDPVTALDAINTAKVITGIIILTLAAYKGLSNSRRGLYLGLHMSYLCWWLSEQWLFEPFQDRFSKPVSGIAEYIFFQLMIGVFYALPAWNAFFNKKEISGGVLAFTVFIYGVGSMINVLSDVQMQAHKAALLPAKSLVTTGIYRLARNPNYLGDWMRYTSFALCSGRISSFILPALIVALNLNTLTDPDAKGSMAGKYGKEFTDWLERVPSTVVPMPDDTALLGMCIVLGIWVAWYILACTASMLCCSGGKDDAKMKMS